MHFPMLPCPVAEHNISSPSDGSDDETEADSEVDEVSAPGRLGRDKSFLLQCRNGAVSMDDLDSQSHQHTSKKKSRLRKCPCRSKSCQMHFANAPMKLVGGSGVSVFDEDGNVYLDCVSGVSQVGHCHPSVVDASQSAMAKMCLGSDPNCVTSIVEMSLPSSFACYTERILQTMPEPIDRAFVFTSGSSANDAAIQIARQFTGHHDVVVFQNAFHGCLGTVSDISPKTAGIQKPDWVHILPVPDLYRGKYWESDHEAVSKYLKDVKILLDSQVSNGRQIACLVTEPIFTFHGVVCPSPSYFQGLFSYIRSLGALTIVDEVQTGLGRTGSHNLWAFQSLGIVPDIVTTGKPISNGYPMGLLMTSRNIANSSQHLSLNTTPSEIQNAICNSVLDVLHDEKLMDNAEVVGNDIMQGVERLKAVHKNIGDVRGQGLLIGIDIVEDQDRREPSSLIANAVLHFMRSREIIVSIDGEMDNVIVMFPPLCFSRENAKTFLSVLDEAMTAIEERSCPNVRKCRIATCVSSPSSQSESSGTCGDSHQTSNSSPDIHSVDDSTGAPETDDYGILD